MTQRVLLPVLALGILVACRANRVAVSVTRSRVSSAVILADSTGIRVGFDTAAKHRGIWIVQRGDTMFMANASTELPQASIVSRDSASWVLLSFVEDAPTGSTLLRLRQRRLIVAYSSWTDQRGLCDPAGFRNVDGQPLLVEEHEAIYSPKDCEAGGSSCPRSLASTWPVLLQPVGDTVKDVSREHRQVFRDRAVEYRAAIRHLQGDSSGNALLARCGAATLDSLRMLTDRANRVAAGTQ